MEGFDQMSRPRLGLWVGARSVQSRVGTTHLGGHHLLPSFHNFMFLSFQLNSNDLDWTKAVSVLLNEKEMAE